MKIIKIILGVLVFASLASCQQSDIDSASSGDAIVPVKLTASFNSERTKVSYEFLPDSSDADHCDLQPSWETGDKVVGFDEHNKTYTFTVSTLDGGYAILEGNAPLNCTLHLIYFPGAKAEDINGGKMIVNYDNQNGNKTMPAVMLADGDVINGTGGFFFRNAGATLSFELIHTYNDTPFPSDAKINKITIEGFNISEALIELDENNKLKLTSKDNGLETISTGSGFVNVDYDPDPDGVNLIPKVMPTIALPDACILTKISFHFTNEDEYLFTPIYRGKAKDDIETKYYLHADKHYIFYDLYCAKQD